VPERTRVWLFLIVILVFLIAIAAFQYEDDEPNPWYVEAAFALFWPMLYLAPLLIVGTVIWAVARGAGRRRRR